MKPFIHLMLFGFSAIYPAYGNADHLSEPYSLHTIRLIPRAYIAYQKKIWREVDLEKRPNSSCFMRGKEISKLLLAAAKKQLLTPYQDDKLETAMPYEQFLKNLQLPAVGGLSQAAPHEFFPSEISTLGLVEYIIVNKITAKQEHHIESIQFIVPGRKNAPTYLDHVIATFKYKDVANYLKKMPFEEICWYTDANPAQYLTWLDAFDLRLFTGRIVKVDNLDDATISDLYNKSSDGDEAFIISQKIEEKLDLEIAHFLSEY